MDVGIVWGVDLRIGDGDFFFLRTKGVLDGRVDLERHADFQTFQDDGCDRHLVFLELRLAFDHGCDGDEVMERHVLRFGFPADFRRQHFVGSLVHDVTDLARGIV